MNIEIEEVGLREGLQSNDVILSEKDKINLIERLIDSGLERIQLGSFVNPEKVPQMRGVDNLFRHFCERKGIIFTGLALNKRGVLRAIDAGVKNINISVSASDTHQMKNTGKTKIEALKYLKEMIYIAKDNGMSVKGGIQAAFGCFYEGKIPVEAIHRLLDFYMYCDVDEYNLSDTAGFATPGVVKEILSYVGELVSFEKISLHMHDTLGMGLVNIFEAMNCGISRFDSSIAGMGGCPLYERCFRQCSD
ncbi:hypothetical protein [Flexistipes sinusarabici]|uniref:hypothetical protein n=1 Tax=Flexistipes sinusarabici TaxID=2352 RepID=UPI00031B1506|nr:hypothetical protein [Flexistipes sinusarabici]